MATPDTSVNLISAIQTPDSTVRQIRDFRVPVATASDAGKIIKVNSGATAFEYANENVTTITFRRWEDDPA